jgi:hypothetical protein
MCGHSDRLSDLLETVHVGNQLLELCLRLAILRLRILYIFIVIDRRQLARTVERTSYFFSH